MADLTTSRILCQSNTRRIVGLDGPNSQIADFNVEYDQTWQDGTGNSQANEVFYDRRTLAVGNESLDLTALTQSDDDGDSVRTPISFQNVKELWIHNRNAPGAAGVLTVGGGSTGAGAADAFAGAGTPFVADSDLVDIPAGGIYHWTDPGTGAPVVNATADDLHFVAAGATVIYDVKIAGIAT